MKLLVIELSNTDQVALVDAEDYPILSRYSWRINPKGYVVTSLGNQTIRLHRFIMNPSKNDQIDHANMDKLDNRKCNLRVCCSMLNQANTLKRSYVNGRKTSSKYKGVHKVGSKWVARLNHKGHRYSLGRYDNEDEAGRAYNEKALEIWGAFARLNKIEERGDAL